MIHGPARRSSSASRYCLVHTSNSIQRFEQLFRQDGRAFIMLEIAIDRYGLLPNPSRPIEQFGLGVITLAQTHIHKSAGHDLNRLAPFLVLTLDDAQRSVALAQQFVNLLLKPRVVS